MYVFKSPRSQLSGAVRGDSMDFKSRGLRDVRGVRGYAIDFKAGGFGLSGDFGGIRSSTFHSCRTVYFRTVRYVFRFLSKTYGSTVPYHEYKIHCIVPEGAKER